jgi:glyoxylate carboligase
MKVVDAISEILNREGVEFLSCYPTNVLIEAAAKAGIRPIVCRQKRVGVGIADGFTRITNGGRIGVFTLQAGPGAENAFSGLRRPIPTRCQCYACPLATLGTSQVSSLPQWQLPPSPRPLDSRDQPRCR